MVDNRYELSVPNAQLTSLFSPAILCSSFNSQSSHLSLLPTAFMDLYRGHLECDTERMRVSKMGDFLSDFLRHLSY